MLGTPLVIGVPTWLFGVVTGLCGLHGSECSPEEERRLLLLGIVVALCFAAECAACVALFVLRRRFFWLLWPVLALGALLRDWMAR